MIRIYRYARLLKHDLTNRRNVKITKNTTFLSLNQFTRVSQPGSFAAIKTGTVKAVERNRFA